MPFWIDVVDASGIHYGMIQTATAWQNTRRLDAAGTFQFTMPVTDSNSNLLEHKRIVRAWQADENGIRELGAGIIDSIVIEPAIDGATMITVGGDDMMRELTYRTVGELDLFDEAVYPVDSLEMSFSDNSSPVAITLPDDIDLAPGSDRPANFLNIAYAVPFGCLRFTLTTPNTTPATITLQYLNGTDQVSPKGLKDSTVVEGVPFAQSGTISWDIPTDWVPVAAGYSIRISCYPEDLTAFYLTAVSVIQIEPISDALQRIMALAPPGWSLDAAGSYATESTVCMQCTGESVLAALVRLGEQTGEHFRLSTSGRRIEWLGSAQRASGLRAIAAAQPSDATLLILRLRWERDSYALWNRLYVFGGGSGADRLTLANTSRAAPVGFALSKAMSYLESTISQASLGRIDHGEVFSDITPVDLSASAKTVAANSLFDRALVLLSKHTQQQQIYDLSIVPAHDLILPGQTIRVIYDEWIDAYHALSINADLVVLEVAQQVGEEGIRTAGLTVATVDYWPVNDYRAVARALGDIQVHRAVKPPQTGLSSSGRGVPVAMSVENGLVTALSRETPVADGVYPGGAGLGIDQLTIRNGMLIAINGVTSP